MKYFTEPNGKFVIQIPTEWRYANVAAEYEEKSPFSFQTYENPTWSFQVSCYSESEKPLNKTLKKQNFNTKELEFIKLRNDGGGFNMHLWGARVEDHMLMAKFIYDSHREKDQEIKNILKQAEEALATLELLSPDQRKVAYDLDKYEKFMASLAASFDIKNKALANGSFIEFTIIVANQIDAYLRLAIVMTEQLNNKTDDLKIEYLYQAPTDKPVMERKIYSIAKDYSIISENLFDSLEELYKERNKIVHRYIISEFRTRQLLEIAYKYESVCEQVRLIIKEIEDLQFEKKIGIYGNGQHPQEEPSEKALKFLHSQINDKHLMEQFERKITAPNNGSSQITGNPEKV